MAEWVGRTLDGRYAVEAILGQGGMGVVLRAHHKFTGAQVAVKMLHRELHLDPQLETRFLAEARASNQIGHPAIVQVLDAGRTPEGELYLVMELLTGQPMRDALKRRIPPIEVRRIARELLDALAAAHARGFVHRDLKPENAFLAAPNASVKLLDFGIAKGVKGATLSPQTQAGVLLGTLAYMAPEQLQDASTVDPRADLWAVGVMIYEMLAGRLPYQATTIEEMFVMLARNEPDPISKWIPTVAPAIEQFFARALARDPNARFGSAPEMAAAVAQLPLDPLAPAPQTPAHGMGGATMATGFAQTPRPQIPNTPMTPPHGQPLTGPHPYVQRDPTGQHARVSGPGRNIAIVGGVAVVVAIALAVLIATQKHSPPQVAQVATADAAIAAPVVTPIDAAIVIDADVAKTVPKHGRDAGTTLHDGGTGPLDPYANDCAAKCSFLGTCGLRSQNCLAECAKTNGYNGCVASAAGDCDKFAACFLAAGCGPVGTGTASCSDTLDCQLHCSANDKTCACRCAASAAQANLGEWLAYNTCIAGCAGNKDCATRQCTGAYNRCKAR